MHRDAEVLLKYDASATGAYTPYTQVYVRRFVAYSVKYLLNV